MPRKALTSVSPVDGRYSRHTEPLVEFFSEYALFKYRVRIEIEYLIQLASEGLKGVEPLKEQEQNKLRSLYENFTLQDAEQIKTIERTTNHDVKAVEYFVKEQLEKFEAAVEEMEKGLKPLLSADRKEMEAALDPLERARVHIALANSVSTLYASE